MPISSPLLTTVTAACLDDVQVEERMENTSTILTIKEVAQILRVSRAHVHNVLSGKVVGVPKLTHLMLGRRRLVRREWLDQWLEASRTR